MAGGHVPKLRWSLEFLKKDSQRSPSIDIW